MKNEELKIKEDFAVQNLLFCFDAGI